MSTVAFTAEEKQSYRENGYVMRRKFFEADELASWRDRLTAIADGRVTPGPTMTVMRDVMVAKGAVTPGSRLEAIAKLQYFEDDPVLATYLVHPRLLDIIASLLGPDLMLIHNMLINKPPNVDGRHPLHQDIVYFPFRPPDKLIGTWTALEPATRENGCLVVVPGTHTGKILPHADPQWEWINRGYFGAKGVGPETERVHLEMDPGDTVFFHPVILHGSGQNKSTGFRRAISAHYGDIKCEWIWPDTAIGNRPFIRVRGTAEPQGWKLSQRTIGSAPA